MLFHASWDLTRIVRYPQDSNEEKRVNPYDKAKTAYSYADFLSFSNGEVGMFRVVALMLPLSLHTTDPTEMLVKIHTIW